MKEGWEYKKLGDLCVLITDGSHFSPKSSEEGLYPMLSVKDMENNGFNYSDCKFISKDDYNILVSNGCKPEVNDVLIAKDGSYLKTAFVQKEEKEQAILSSIAIVRPKLDILDPEYVAVFFRSPKAKSIVEKHYLTGTAIKRIILKGFRALTIPFPSLQVQQSIVSELDLINDLIAKKKAQLADLDSLAQSLFYEMFGDPVENEKRWEVKKLGEVAIVKTGPFGSMLHKEDYVTDGIPLINPMHMQDFKIVPNREFTISEDKASELNNYMLKTNDVVFARRGDIGRCAIVGEKENGFLCGTGSLFVRFTRDVSATYTMYVVKSDSFAKELISKAKGATMLNLNSSTMDNLKFPLPPLSLQQTFASRIEAIEEEKQKIQSSLKDLETLLAARMQYWFE